MSPAAVPPAGPAGQTGVDKGIKGRRRDGFCGPGEASPVFAGGQEAERARAGPAANGTNELQPLPSGPDCRPARVRRRPDWSPSLPAGSTWLPAGSTSYRLNPSCFRLDHCGYRPEPSQFPDGSTAVNACIRHSNLLDPPQLPTGSNTTIGLNTTAPAWIHHSSRLAPDPPNLGLVGCFLRRLSSLSASEAIAVHFD